MNKKELKEIIKVYSFEVNWLKNKNKQLEKDKEELQKQLNNKDMTEGEKFLDKIHNMASCMLSILDSLKLYDNGVLLLDNETLSEVMFRKMKAYNIDLNKELGFTHLKPITKNKL